jgi:outer membrane protein
MKSVRVPTIGLLVAGLLATAAPAAAQAVYSGLNTGQMLSLGDHARDLGRVDEAVRLYDALSGDPDLEIRTEARFRKGMTLAQAGRFREAAVAFRTLLDEKPDATRVRLELGRVLMALGDEAGARRALRQAQAAGLPQDVRVVVDQFAAALISRQPWGGSFSIALAPDTNINRATSAKQLDTVIAPLNLDEAAREQSGLGFKAGGQVYARKVIAPRMALLAQASASATLYRESDFDDVLASVLVGPEIQWGADRWRPAVGVTGRWYGRIPYADTRTVQVNWLHSLGGKTQLVTDLSVSDAHYRLNELQDGRITQLALSLEHAFSARSGGALSLDAGRQTARDPGYATTSGGVGLLAWREVGRLTLIGSASYSRLDSDDRLFPYTDARQDDLARLAAGIHFRQLKVRDFAPVVRLVHERNRSTVGIYDYRRNALEVGLDRVF